MGMFSFIKEAGEKLFGHKEVETAAAAAATDAAAAEKLAQLNAGAAQGIATYIAAQNIDIEGMVVEFDGATGTVTLQGSSVTVNDSGSLTIDTARATAGTHAICPTLTALPDSPAWRSQ